MSERGNVIAVIVAAGKGVRAGGGVPKQHRPINGRSAFERTLARFANCPGVDAVLPVIRAGDEPLVDAAMARVRGSLGDTGAELLAPVAGGTERQQSVRIALEAIAASGAAPHAVLIHDAARPFTPAEVIIRVIEALKAGAPAACPALPVVDTLRRDENGLAGELVDRAGLSRAQTPQGFAFAPLLDAHRRFAETAVTDDVALIALAGFQTTLVEGDEAGFKITAPADFDRAEMQARAEDARDAAGLNEDPMEYRTGTGFDVHAFGPNADGTRDHVWLCGIKVPHEDGLKGHSDADVGLHALTDAVLGALSFGDIGAHFPPSDEEWRGATSDRFLRFAADAVTERCGRLTHLDVTLICERPKIRPHVETMRARIAEIVGLTLDRVSVKATTTEQLGFAGRREGIAAMASATVALPAPD